MSRYIEDQNQAALMSWANHTKIYVSHQNILLIDRAQPTNSAQFNESTKPISDYLIAIPNGGKRNAKEAARFKLQGVKAGVSDLFLALPCGGYNGLWIELKRPIVTGKPKPQTSALQKEWLENQRAVGFCGFVCYGVDDAMTLIRIYLQQDQNEQDTLKLKSMQEKSLFFGVKDNV